jgi:hypothetical protein
VHGRACGSVHMNARPTTNMMVSPRSGRAAWPKE